MDNIPYEQWAEYVIGLLREDGIHNGLILDLGCWNRQSDRKTGRCRYDMIGIDNSIEMLEIAKEKSIGKHEDILYLFQDMREFELYGTVRGIVSICDSWFFLEIRT